MDTSTSRVCLGQLALHAAIVEGNCFLVDNLLIEGANIEEQYQYGNRPLHVAVNHCYCNDDSFKILRHESIVDRLLSRGAFVDAKNCEGDTPLHIAVRFHQISIVERLLYWGANLTIRNFDNETPFDIAVLEACDELTFFINLYDILTVAELLLEHGTEVDWNKHCELLHIAVGNNVDSLVKTLLERGIDVNVKDSSNQTALHAAVEAENARLVEILIDKGADINAKDKLGKTPLNLVVERIRPDMFDTVAVLESLVNRGASLDIPYQKDYTPLHAAVIGQSSSLVDKLLQRGFSVNIKDKRGITPLHEACVLAEPDDTINLLLERGADLEALENFGYSPLQVAAERGFTPAVKLLLSKGANVNSKSFLGDTPLHSLINKISTDTDPDKFIELLIYGASLEMENNKGLTPLQILCDAHRLFPDLVDDWLITCKNHILKLYSAGLTVLGKVAIDCVRNIDEAFDHKQLEEEYHQELKVINNTTVGENKLGIVFSSFSRPYYFANKSLLRSIQELVDSPHLCQMFPHYSVILELSFSKSRNAYNLFYVATQSLNNLLSHNQVLPSLIIFKIVELLDDSAQRQLVKSGLCCAPSSLAPDWCDDLPESIREYPFGHYLSNWEVQQLLSNM